MPSCSSSSNIMSAITSVNLNSIGSRILAQIPLSSSDYTIESGITAGDAIRYDVTDDSNKQYKRSLADGPENAEVVGVVESIDDDSLNVVIFGQINFPGEFTNATPAGTPEGASGGNDIYFLSPTVAGGIQNIAPFQQTQVVKPVLQKMDAGANNAVVLNYIGYSIGGEIAATSSTDEFIGTIQTIVEEDGPETIPPNYIVVSGGSQSLKVSEYPDAYTYFGKRFGYVEEVTLSGLNVTQSLVAQSAKQKDGRSDTYTGRIISVDTSANTITVNRTSSQTQADTSLEMTIDGNTYTVASTEVKEFTVPRIVPTTQYRFDVDGSQVEVNTKTILKVKNIQGVTIPTKLSVTDLEVTNKLTTNTASADTLDDINATVNSINTELTSVKTKLGLI